MIIFIVPLTFTTIIALFIWITVLKLFHKPDQGRKAEYFPQHEEETPGLAGKLGHEPIFKS